MSRDLEPVHVTNIDYHQAPPTPPPVLSLSKEARKASRDILVAGLKAHGTYALGEYIASEARRLNEYANSLRTGDELLDNLLAQIQVSTFSCALEIQKTAFNAVKFR